MKKVFLTALIAIAIVSSSFASETNVNAKVKNSFVYDFKNVDKVEWTTSANFVTAAFVYNQIRMNAFYDLDGTLIGTSHAVTVESLPAKAKKAYNKRYADYTVKEAIKFEKNNDTAYFISIEKGTESMVLKVSGDMISVFQKG